MTADGEAGQGAGMKAGDEGRMNVGYPSARRRLNLGSSSNESPEPAYPVARRQPRPAAAQAARSAGVGTR